MNTKRWVAVGVSVFLFMVSLMASGESRGLFSNRWDVGTGEVVVKSGDHQNRIAVLEVNGAIADTGAGFLWNEGYNHTQFLSNLDKIKEDPTIRGIILKVNSPGGGVYESAQIRDKMLELRGETELPIYVSMGNMAASGGYYISADADKIFAGQETITGSIGVVMSSLNFAGLMEQYGITDNTIKSGEYKDIGSISRAMTEDEQNVLQGLIDNSYDRFVDVIVKGRGMSEERVKQLADGRIYDGMQAKEVGLIDEIGYFDDVVKALETDLALDTPEVFAYKHGNRSFFDMLDYRMTSFIKKEANPLEKIGSMIHLYDNGNTPRLMYLYGGF
ncbi:signal peptide peptidase SppA [Serpentinicella sp. ANB-PHB4]|uniref:signal peptide peptidase SppA n=1 Tax=Serpentinicella sp. ANB-PHB4 TaxID=3074076 RepID=UPI002867A91D|nr:signal peptide peptidase SppA [Serpentinicella sp. ANB-PHB4]MDR5659278.1 signal peptide peptidase SppA [Serpentinicella sp. ANB-PHB4]